MEFAYIDFELLPERIVFGLMGSFVYILIWFWFYKNKRIDPIDDDVKRSKAWKKFFRTEIEVFIIAPVLTVLFIIATEAVLEAYDAWRGTDLSVSYYDWDVGCSWLTGLGWEAIVDKLKKRAKLD